MNIFWREKIAPREVDEWLARAFWDICKYFRGLTQIRTEHRHNWQIRVVIPRHFPGLVDIMS